MRPAAAPISSPAWWRRSSTRSGASRSIVENRAGAGGNLGAEAVFTAAPDGYTLLFTAQGPLVVNKSLYGKLNYDPDAFTPVSLVVVAYSTLLANPKVPAADAAGADRLCQGQSRQAQLRLAGHRHRRAPDRRTVQLDGRRQDQPRAVSRQRAGAQRSDCRPRRHHVRRTGAVDAVCARRTSSRRWRSAATSGSPPCRTCRPWRNSCRASSSHRGGRWWRRPTTPPAITDKISAAVAEVLKSPDMAAKLTDMSHGSDRQLAGRPCEVHQGRGRALGRGGAHLRCGGAIELQPPGSSELEREASDRESPGGRAGRPEQDRNPRIPDAGRRRRTAR